jgi:hypothetical protein
LPPSCLAIFAWFGTSPNPSSTGALPGPVFQLVSLSYPLLLFLPHRRWFQGLSRSAHWTPTPGLYHRGTQPVIMHLNHLGSLYNADGVVCKPQHWSRISISDTIPGDTAATWSTFGVARAYMTLKYSSDSIMGWDNSMSHQIKCKGRKMPHLIGHKKGPIITQALRSRPRNWVTGECVQHRSFRYFQ